LSEADKPLLQMSWPLMVSFTMRAAFSLVDTIYAATLGDAAVAAIGLAVPFEFVMVAIWVGLSSGLTAGLSRAMGRAEHRKVEQYLRAASRLVQLTTPAFAAVGLAIWWLAPKAGLEPDVLAAFRMYGTTLVFGSAFTMFWSVIPDSIVKAHQDTRSTMWAGIWSNVINVVLNTLFTFVFHWGVFGIAFSTVLGRFGGLAYALHRAARHERKRKERDGAGLPDLDPHPYRAILALAIPGSLGFALMAAESALVNGVLANLPNPKEGLAAYSIYFRVVLFALNPVIAISVAMLPYAARRYSRRDAAGIGHGVREAIATAAVYAVVVVAPIALLGGRAIAAALSESPLTEEYAAVALRVVPLAVILGTPFLLCRPAFEGMGRGRPGLWMAVLRYVVLTAPLAWIGALVVGRWGAPALYGVLAGLLVAAALSSAAFLAWLRSALARAFA